MDMIDIIKSVIIGIVEGITEWLPISSTGHIILTDRIIPLSASAQFKEMFNVVIQLGAIMAVVVMFFDKLWPFTTKQNGYIKKDSISLWMKVVIAVLPAAVIGIPFDDWFTEKFHNEWVISAMLILYGILFILIECFNKNRAPKINTLGDISYKTALIIGAFQMLSLIPGTSRSGATILGAMVIGVSRVAAAEFSFYLAVPVMFGASIIKVLDFGFNITGMEFVVLMVGMVTAFIVSVVAIKFLLGYVKKKDFKFFGYYRIVLGLLVLAYFSFIAK